MISFIKKLSGCFYRAAGDTIHHDGIEHAGYLAFLGLLALFPFLVLFFAIVGAFGQGDAGAEFIQNTLLALPDKFTVALRPRIEEIMNGPPQGLITVAILGALWTASSAVEGLRTTLNRAYRVAAPPAYWVRRLFSIAELLVFIFILAGGVLLLIAIPLALSQIENLLGLHVLSEHEEWLARLAWWLTMAMVFFAVSYIYYFIPNIKQSLLAVMPGAAVVVGLWIGAAALYALYLANFNQVTLIYGSLGGIIAALIFFYICNVIFIFGAEFNYHLAHMLGLRVTKREESV